MGLTQHGESVEIWAPEAPGPDPADRGVAIHRLRSVRARNLAELAGRIASSRTRERLFVKYVPQAFGVRGMNVDLIRSLVRRPAELWVQVHGGAIGWDSVHGPAPHWICGVQCRVARAADHVSGR